MRCLKRRRPEKGSNRASTVCLLATYSYVVAEASSSSSSSSSFPGMQPSVSEINNNNAWWSSSPFESSSSSDWEWEDDDEMIDDRSGAINSMSDDGDAELFSDASNTKNTTTDRPSSSSSARNNTIIPPTATATAATATTSNKPLQTLEKLQQMLDETDYMTNTDGSRPNHQQIQRQHHQHSNQDELWTSKDRSKYKKQQKRAQRPSSLSQQQASSSEANSFHQQTPPRPPEQQLPQQQQQQQQQWYTPPVLVPPPPYNSPSTMELPPASDEEMTELSETDGDGLGYTLPNLPVYLSDDEDEGAESDAAATSITATSADTNNALPPRPPQQQQAQSQPIVPSQHQTPQYYHHPPPHPIHQQRQQQQQQQQQFPSYGYGYPYPTNAGQQQYYSWVPPPPPPSFYYPRPYVPRMADPRRPYYEQQRQRIASSPLPSAPTSRTAASAGASEMLLQQHEQSYPSTILPAANKPTFRVFGSLLKLSTCVALSMLVSYAAVSPVAPQHHLTMYELNQQFNSVMRLVAWTSLPPLAVFWFGVVDVMDDSLLQEDSIIANSNTVAAAIVEEEPMRRRNPHKTTVATLIDAFYNAFTWGYCLLFGLQIVATTVGRLAIFFKWERPVFDLTPNIPLLIVPWVLREHGYKPKRITLIVQDFVASCLLSPILEEYLKLMLLKMTKLPKNFHWKRIKGKQRHNNNKSRMVAEPIQGDGEAVINVNAYVSNMLAVTLGIKLADSIRRVCMYTKPQHSAKTFYAFFRGIFPVRELCGTATALALARRDVLGQHVPLWKLLLPACVIHGMANFRGMKPIFKWNSATPWVEMQLSPPTIDFSNTKGMELFGQLFPKLLWLTILARVMGYCVKNYYMINRQAVKRTTTYAGKHSAFSAELAATEMLKVKSKKGEKG